MSLPAKRRPHGAGGLFKRASDGLWVGRVEAGFDEYGNRRRLQVTARTKTDAATKLKALQRRVATGDTPEAGTGGRATVKSWADTWLTMHEGDVRPNVYATDKGHVRKWIVPTLGARRLADLNPGDVRRLHVAITSAGRSSTTALNVHRTFMQMLKAARLEGHPIQPRVRDVKAPRPAASDRTSIPVNDLLAILDVTGRRDDSARWLFRILYPLRQGEALGLTWDCLDLDGHRIHLDWQLDQYPRDVNPPTWLRSRHLEGTMWLVEPKTKSRHGSLPLLPTVARQLQAWQTIAPPNPHGLVWVDHKNRPIRDDIDRKEWHAIQKEADVAHPDGRPWHLHETRHTAASLFISAGEDPRTIAAILGQTKLVESYVHVDDPSIMRAMTGFAKTLGIED